MREYIKYTDVANSVMMLSSTIDGTVVVVEGLTDRRLYGKFFDNDSVGIVIANSKHNVRDSVKTVYYDRKLDSVIGIMDSDLDILTNKKTDPPLFETDTRDSESLMFRSYAYDDVLQEYGEPELIEKFERTYGPIREAVLRGCYPLGMLMYVSNKHRLELSFKDLDFEAFISKKDLSCDVYRMIKEIVSNSFNPAAEIDEIAELLDAVAERDVWSVCRGHDIISVMAIGLRNIFGGNNGKYVKDLQLSGSFRLAFTGSDMRETALYHNTEEWCNSKGLTLWKIRA